MEFKHVEQYIKRLPGKTIIIANQIYKELFYDLSFNTFLKYLTRLEDRAILKSVSKGVYCRVLETPFGKVGVGDKEIKDFFISENETGIEVGYGLYNKYRLTTQISKVIKIYSNKVTYKTQKIKNVKIEKFKFQYSKQLQFTVEYMEILENYTSIEDCNSKAFFDLCKKIAEEYDERNLKIVYGSGGYKKRTIAFLRAILNSFNIDHGLDRYLNPSSKYKYPEMEELYVA
mgnify:CR=1 FL=1